MRVTLFRDVHARSKEERDLSLAGVAELISATHAPGKHDLPLLKLGTFGDAVSENGSLRHDANLSTATGVECDYDGETVPFDAAVAAARAVGAAALLYTSPSHTPDKPRWRALFPFAAPVSPPERSALADRANGIFGAILSRETWTLSQAFYFGRADGAPDFRLVLLEGDTIDALSDQRGAPYVKTRPEARSDASADAGSSVEDLPPRIKRAVKSGDPKAFGHSSRSETVFMVACGLVRAGWSDERGAALLADREYRISDHVREQGRPEAYARKQMADARARVGEDWNRAASGAILPNDQLNVGRALEHLGIKLSYDSFSNRGYVNGAGPLREIDDRTLNEIRLGVDRECGFLPAKDFFYDLIDFFATRESFHPVLDYFDSLAHDSTPRIGAPSTLADPGHPSWLTTYGGAPDTPYVRAVGRLILIAAVRRVRRPGVKFDQMLVLVDPNQGTNKSSVLRALARRDDWFTDSLPLNARDKEVIEHLSGRWIVEFGELNGIRHHEVEAVKAFLSRQVDRARLAYGRLTSSVPRQCIFFGTTNSETFLRDLQNRRFWPVRVAGFDLPSLERDVDQLWAEAALAELAGESIELPAELWPLAAGVQLEHRQEDPWASAIDEVLKNLNGKVAANDVWKIVGKPLGQRLQPDNQRLGEAMRSLGFLRKHTTAYGRVAWCYLRGDSEEAHRQIYILSDPITATMIASHSPTGDDPDAAPYDPDPANEEIPF